MDIHTMVGVDEIPPMLLKEIVDQTNTPFAIFLVCQLICELFH